MAVLYPNVQVCFVYLWCLMKHAIPLIFPRWRLAAKFQFKVCPLETCLGGHNSEYAWLKYFKFNLKVAENCPGPWRGLVCYLAWPHLQPWWGLVCYLAWPHLQVLERSREARADTVVQWTFSQSTAIPLSLFLFFFHFSLTFELCPDAKV